MDIFFQDPDEIPLPPEEVRILDLQARPYPDGRRLRVYLEVTPFQKRPSAEVSVVNALAQKVAEITIIQTLTRKLEFTMHLRGPQPQGEHTLDVRLFYDPALEEPPLAASDEVPPPPPVDRPPAFTVDQRQLAFTPPPPAPDDALPD